MSSRAAFAAAAAAVLAAAALPWSDGPLRRLAGGEGDGRDPAFDVELDAAALRAAAPLVGDSEYVTEWPGGSPLEQGNLKAAGQLYLARGLPVLERERAEWVVLARNGRVVVVRRAMSLVAGVLVLNAAFLAAGYALLGPARWRLSWAGVALLVGAGSVGTLVFFATILGLHASLPVAAAVTAAVVVGGFLFWRRNPVAAAPSQVRPLSSWAAAAFGVVAAVCAVGVVGGFRSAPWLDDVWGIWLPKGLALWHHGLDERLFAPSGQYVTFGVPDYPLWWSVVTSLDVQAVGGLDVRVVCAQLALLTVAFVGAVARLLWDCVRPPVLAGSLLLLVLSPELWRHVQGGVADLPLAIYLALAVVAGARWLQTREPFLLALAGLALAVADSDQDRGARRGGGARGGRSALLAASALARACAPGGVAVAGVAMAARRAESRGARPDPRRARARRGPRGRRAPLRPDGVARPRPARDPARRGRAKAEGAARAGRAARGRPRRVLDRPRRDRLRARDVRVPRDRPGRAKCRGADPLLAESFLQQRESLREDRALVGEP